MSIFFTFQFSADGYFIFEILTGNPCPVTANQTSLTASLLAIHDSGSVVSLLLFLLSKSVT